MIFNSFVEEFSYKSMVCISFVICVWVWANATFNQLRHECERARDDEKTVWQREYYARCRAHTQLPQHAPHAQQPVYEVEEQSSDEEENANERSV
jgi:hypothetical protein